MGGDLHVIDRPKLGVNVGHRFAPLAVPNAPVISRKDVLLKALEAEVGGASVDPGTLFTDDVVGWSPYATVSGLTALADLCALREVAFSNVVITFRGRDEVGNKAFAECLVEADHTGATRAWRG